MVAHDLSGQRFGRWLVGERGPNGRFGHAQWRCRCECGTERLIKAKHLRNGGSQSCGCLRNELTGRRFTTHGGHRLREYNIWAQMWKRCYWPKAANYKWYGARGITVCDRWRDFPAFLADMGYAPKDHTLDRINNDGNYEPGNCRWASHVEQANNRRRPARVRS